MPRTLLIIEFDGSPYCGWQRQDNGPSVQAVVEAAGKALCGVHTPVYGAGRTDSGVHALAMAAHIDLPKHYDPDTVRDALNAHMRQAPVSILSARDVPDRFHARFSCKGRRYLYRILNRRSPPSLDRHRIWHVPGPLDVDRMRIAAQDFVGLHDLTTFRSVNCQADSPVKTIDSVEVTSAGEEIRFRIAAPSFLHNQVRSMVGSLVQIGLGRWPEDGIAKALAARDRIACGPVAPPDGLYFEAAVYADAAFSGDRDY